MGLGTTSPWRRRPIKAPLWNAISGLLTLIPVLAFAQGGSSEPLRGRSNPFVDVLRLDERRISLSRDSTRVPLDDGGYLDLILRSKKPYRIARFDRRGDPVECGDLVDGHGTVILRFGKVQLEAEFDDGLLNGFAREAWVRKDSLWTVNLGSFPEGELDGDSRMFSRWDPRYVAHVLTYEKGQLVRHDQFGKWSTWHAFIPFYPKVTDPLFLCSRTVYGKGKPVKHECFVKKCRRCGG